MLFSLTFLIFLEASRAAALVPRNPEPATSSNAICKSGIYAGLAPLAHYGPAQAFCASRYPQTVTVSAGKKKRTVSTTPKAPSTTPKAGTTTTSTIEPSSTTQYTTLSSAECTKDKLDCLWSSVAGDIAKTVSPSLLPIVSIDLTFWPDSIPHFAGC
jgi:hypothetical protein